MITKKYYYCPKCKKYPDNITEIIESEPKKEYSSWNGKNYEFQDNNSREMDNDSITAICTNCKTELVEE